MDIFPVDLTGLHSIIGINGILASILHDNTGITFGINGILVSINPPIQQTIQTKNQMFVRNLVIFFDIIITTQSLRMN